jgi:hypothetical protein
MQTILSPQFKHKSKGLRSAEIRTIESSAPWVLLSKAAEHCGLNIRQLRKLTLQIRRFGNADYVRPSELNSWILGEERGRI